MNPTALGTGASVLNAYPLVNSEGVYNGQREAAPDQRVFILTRSAYAGPQRYAAATWSGDILDLDHCASRFPRPRLLPLRPSVLDDGHRRFHGAGSSRGKSEAENVEEWRELNTRWFQYGAFLPIPASTGAPKREMWHLAASRPTRRSSSRPPAVSPAALRLLVGWRGHAGRRHDHASARYGLPRRPDAREIPINTCSARRSWCAGDYLQGRGRSVLSPAAPAWYDFWTGAVAPRAGASGSTRAAPYDAIPLFVRAGSIVPFGPEIQYTGEKKQDSVTLFVYSGANGSFMFYEDDGLTYGYEKGQFSQIPIRWDNTKKTLTRETRGFVPGNADQSDVRGRGSLEGEAGRLLVHAEGRPQGQLQRGRSCGPARVRALA